MTLKDTAIIWRDAMFTEGIYNPSDKSKNLCEIMRAVCAAASSSADTTDDQVQYIITAAGLSVMYAIDTGNFDYFEREMLGSIDFTRHSKGQTVPDQCAAIVRGLSMVPGYNEGIGSAKACEHIALAFARMSNLTKQLKNVNLIETLRKDEPVYYG